MFKSFSQLRIAILLLALSGVLIFSCQKSNDVTNQKKKALELSEQNSKSSQQIENRSFSTSSSNLTEAEKQQLIQEYGLVAIATSSLPPGFVPKTVNNIQEGRDFLNYAKSITNNSIQGAVNISKSGSTLQNSIKQNQIKETINNKNIIGNSLRIPEGECDGGHGYTTIGFGLFSSITFDFDYNQNSYGQWQVSNTSSHINGVTIGIGWQQWGSVTNSSTTSTVSFCMNGTATVGLDMGGTTFGYQSDYSYRISFNPCTGSGTYREGYGRCQ